MSRFQRRQMIMPELVWKKLPNVLLVLIAAVMLTGCSAEQTQSIPAAERTSAPPRVDPTEPPSVGDRTPVPEPTSTPERAAAGRPTALPSGDRPTPAPTEEAQADEIQLRILAINDFHGHIATSSDSFGGVGRADYLAANIAAARAEVEHSIFVSAGDLVGASPLISGLFHDESTIEAMNLMGLDINGVGNHEFDEGLAELRRMQEGGPHPIDGDLDGDPFGGADFQFLAANVIDDSSGETIFPPYSVREYSGIKVAFIGMTLATTGSIVLPENVSGLTFLDEAETANTLVP